MLLQEGTARNLTRGRIGEADSGDNEVALVGALPNVRHIHARLKAGRRVPLVVLLVCYSAFALIGSIFALVHITHAVPNHGDNYGGDFVTVSLIDIKEEIKRKDRALAELRREVDQMAINYEDDVKSVRSKLLSAFNNDMQKMKNEWEDLFQRLKDEAGSSQRTQRAVEMELKKVRHAKAELESEMKRWGDGPHHLRNAKSPRSIGGLHRASAAAPRPTAPNASRPAVDEANPPPLRGDQPTTYIGLPPPNASAAPISFGACCGIGHRLVRSVYTMVYAISNSRPLHANWIDVNWTVLFNDTLHVKQGPWTEEIYDNEYPRNWSGSSLARYGAVPTQVDGMSLYGYGTSYHGYTEDMRRLFEMPLGHSIVRMFADSLSPLVLSFLDPIRSQYAELHLCVHVREGNNEIGDWVNKTWRHIDLNPVLNATLAAMRDLAAGANASAVSVFAASDTKKTRPYFEKNAPPGWRVVMPGREVRRPETGHWLEHLGKAGSALTRGERDWATAEAVADVFALGECDALFVPNYSSFSTVGIMLARAEGRKVFFLRRGEGGGGEYFEYPSNNGGGPALAADNRHDHNNNVRSTTTEATTTTEASTTEATTTTKEASTMEAVSTIEARSTTTEETTTTKASTTEATTTKEASTTEAVTTSMVKEGSYHKSNPFQFNKRDFLDAFVAPPLPKGSYPSSSWSSSPSSLGTAGAGGGGDTEGVYVVMVSFDLKGDAPAASCHFIDDDGNRFSSPLETTFGGEIYRCLVPPSILDPLLITTPKDDDYLPVSI